MRRNVTLLVVAGLLPVVAVNAAYLLNIALGFEACFPYLEGCASVSRAVRSGPGLWLFKVTALPAMVLMWLVWSRTDAFQVLISDRQSKLIRTAGKAGALFFFVYAVWLGTDGEIYRWMRRYGVVFYFAGTGLAHLLLARQVYSQRSPGYRGRIYVIIVSLTWAAGVASAFKRRLIADEVLLDRVENALEWNFALLLSLSFVAMASLLPPPPRRRP